MWCCSPDRKDVFAHVVALCHPQLLIPMQVPGGSQWWQGEAGSLEMSVGWHHTRSGSWTASELYCLRCHWWSWQAPPQTNGVGVPFCGCLALRALFTLGQVIPLANLTPAISRTVGIAKTELSVVSMRIQGEVQQKLQFLVCHWLLQVPLHSYITVGLQTEVST